METPGPKDYFPPPFNSRLFPFSSFFSPLPPTLLFDLELGHGRSSSGPISLNSRGVHEVCEMAERNPEVRKERKRAMRAKTKEETYKRKTGTPRIRPRRSIVSSPLGGVLFPDVHFRNASSLLISPSRLSHAILRERYCV